MMSLHQSSYWNRTLVGNQARSSTYVSAHKDCVEVMITLLLQTSITERFL
ncbi:hypothetical protein M3J09_005016 [Ascochyta lentis]